MPTTLSYVEHVFAWYRALFDRNVVIDFVQSRRRPVGLRHGHRAEPVLRDSGSARTTSPPTRMVVAISS